MERWKDGEKRNGEMERWKDKDEEIGKQRDAKIELKRYDYTAWPIAAWKCLLPEAWRKASGQRTHTVCLETGGRCGSAFPSGSQW